jgi:hypothetical protein
MYHLSVASGKENWSVCFSVIDGSEEYHWQFHVKLLNIQRHWMMLPTCNKSKRILSSFYNNEEVLDLYRNQKH